MKRTIRAAAFCLSLLIGGFYMLFGVAAAPEDPIDALLRLPAPPPPNPLVTRRTDRYSGYDRTGQPPGDDASIEELIAFWSGQQRSIRFAQYRPEMSDKVFERLTAEIEKDPANLSSLLNSFPPNERSADFIKRIYDGQGANGALNTAMRRSVKEWLVLNSSHFTSELYQRASAIRDTDGYVSNHDELLQLARIDFDRARPLIDRLAANGSGKATGIIAKWARYLNAINTGSTSDIERFRDELKAIVEDKSQPAAYRDLAMDALVIEKEWSGRDDWYMSLLADETLHDLGGYTGLTTLITVSPADKYIGKMIELLKSSNANVRSAAIRNLTMRIGADKPDVIRALLPWLEDAKWAKDVGGSRQRLISVLAEVEMPEAVPGLIAILDEKGKVPDYSSMANMVANTANTAANVYRRPANAPLANTVAPTMIEREAYVYRSAAVRALAKQADPRAAMPLRRALNEADGYERSEIVRALIKCKGFSTDEQVSALEFAVKTYGDAAANVANTAANAMAAAANAIARVSSIPYDVVEYQNNGNKSSVRMIPRPPSPMSAEELKIMLGTQLREDREPSDDLATAVVERIGVLDKRDPKLAKSMREVVIHWGNSAVNLLFIRDLKENKADADAILKLLGSRKEIREKQSSDAHELRNGGPAAIGIASCIFEDANDYLPILDGENQEVKRAFLACARLVRAPLPVTKVAELTKSQSKPLARAAEAYLESEDSPEARAVVLGMHPGEMKIMGATTAFIPENLAVGDYELLNSLFVSTDSLLPGNQFVEEESEPLVKTEKDLIKELRGDENLNGVYAYNKQYVRIYKDKIMFSWDEDDSRYRERSLEKAEFDGLTSYLAQNRVDQLPPFLQCDGSDHHEYCSGRQLLMLGRAGGRRVYMNGEPGAFFAGLDKIFEDLKQTRGKSRYALSREIPGLELILDDSDLHAKTVWKNGPDLRIAASSRAVRKRVEEEIDRRAEEADEADVETEGDDGYGSPGAKVRAELEDKRYYEGYSWRRIVGSTDAGLVAQPPGVDLIPIRDGHPAQATEESWKSRFGANEVRAADNALYSIFSGRATKLLAGNFGFPLATSNGRWIITTRAQSEDEGGGLVRINLATRRVFPVEIEYYRSLEPSVYIPSINKVLLSPVRYEYDDHEEYDEYYNENEERDTIDYDHDPDSLWLLDPDSGIVTKAKGEFRPLTHQTFRPLQKAAGPNQFWAAIADRDKNSTEVGLYDARTFTFKTLLRVPKISFNSMSMWVDEAEKKVYFVYRGHLLSLPLAQH